MTLQANKIDKIVFEEQVTAMNEALETIRLATYDNFFVLKSTDNYIEKYLPFEI